MTKETFKYPRNTLDPIAGFDIFGYLYNEFKNKKELLISCNDICIKNNTFTLERGLMNLNYIKQYTSELKRNYEAKELIKFPPIIILFNSFEFGFSVKTSNEDLLKNYIEIKDKSSFDYAKEYSTTFELKDCILNNLELGVMPDRRVMCAKLTGIFNSIKSYKQPINDFYKQNNY